MRISNCLAAIAALSTVLAAAAPARAADCTVKPPPDLVSPGKLTIGTTLVTPPQGFLDAGKPAGFAVEIGEALAGEMCLTTEVANLALVGLFAGLNARKLDIIISGTAITPERAQSFDFVPYFQGGVRLVVRKGANLSFASEDDLCGLSVAALTGSVEAHALERANKDVCPEGKKITALVYPSWSEAIQQLRKGVAEVGFVDWPFANYLAQTLREFAIASPILSGNPGRVRNRQGVVVRKGDAAMIEAIAAAFERIQARGKYEEILGKWHVEDGDIRRVQ
jgi:polar amino acid transport system substrate-binding protein